MINDNSVKCFTALKYVLEPLCSIWIDNLILAVVLQLGLLFYLPSQAEEVWDSISLQEVLQKVAGLRVETHLSACYMVYYAYTHK